MISLNSTFPLSPPMTRSIDIIDSFLFAYSHIRRDISKVKIQSNCLYQNLIRSFYTPLYFSYSYVPHYDSIHPLNKLCNDSSGKISCLSNASLIQFIIILKLITIILVSSNCRTVAPNVRSYTDFVNLQAEGG